METSNVKIKNRLLYNFCALFLALIIILNGNSIFTSIPGKSTQYFNIMFICFVMAIIVSLFSVKISEYSLRSNIIIIIGLFIYNFCLVIQPANVSDYLYIFKLDVAFTLIFSYYAFCCSNNQLPQLFKSYVFLMTIFGVISLFFWIFGSILHVISPNTSVLSNWASFNGFANTVPSYHNLYFETQQVNGIVRNSAIFTEAPMASLHFSIAFTIEMLFRSQSKRHYFRSFVLLFSVLSTFSSTGYIVIILVIGYKILISDSSQIFIKLKPLLILILIVIGLVLVGNIFSEKMGTESGSIRVDDYKAAFNAWKDKPIMGWGISSLEIRNYMSLWRGYNLGFSSTGIDIMAHSGIYGIIPYLLCLIYGIKKNVVLKNINMLMFISLIIYLVLTTLFTNTFLLFNMFAFIFYISPYTKEKNYGGEIL